MGWLSSEDTVQGKIINVEVKPLRSMQTFAVGMPKVATLIQIKDDKGKDYLGYLNGEVSQLKTNQRIVCTIKKTWNAYWIYRTNGTTTIMPGQFTTGAGKIIYRKIDKYEIVNGG